MNESVRKEPVALSVVEGGDIQPVSRARATLLKRLADVVCLPSSRVNTFERAMTADLLVDMLREASIEERTKVARRLASLTEIPVALSRLLLKDRIEVAAALIVDAPALSDGDVIDCIRHASVEHRRLIACRRGLDELVCEALVEGAEPIVVEALLKNELATISAAGIEMITAVTRESH